MLELVFSTKDSLHLSRTVFLPVQRVRLASMAINS
jgi:hypothetical protein